MRKIQVGTLKLGKAEKRAIDEVVKSGRISEGQKTFAFEQKWARFIGSRHCVATSSGTGALITALTALKYFYKLQERPKVITSPLTYISDVHALIHCGFEPVFVDIDSRDFCIDSDKIRRYLKEAPDVARHSIILAIDLMGYPVELDKIKKIAEEYNLLVLEDSAQAHGTLRGEKKCGADADIAIFSFYVAHNIQAGEMGAITTNNDEIYRLCKKIKANGRYCACEICTRHKGNCPAMEGRETDEDFDPRFYHEFIGYNFKTMEFQAAIALAQMANIKTIIKKRQENVRCLNRGLAGFSGILQLPFFSADVSYLAYPLVIKSPEVICRKELRRELEKRGIETRPLFGSIPTQQPAYAYLKEAYRGKVPCADYAGKNGFYIGCHQYLSSGDLKYIVDSFRDILKKHK